MSMTTLFLLRLNERKKPMPRPGRLRVLSPPGGSTLMTSAPRSARIMPQVGPITICVNSTTRTPASGKEECSVFMVRSRAESRIGNRCRKCLGQAGAPQRAMQGFIGQPAGHALAQRQQPADIDAGFEAHAAQQV